ncbi:MAG: EAL domain-containing protein [Rhizobiales bacterium]|nr:EAL domain-containing protein [Rhizobacter sp.]
MTEARLSRYYPALGPTLGSGDWAWRTALLLAAYYLSGRAGLSMPQFGAHVTLIWPPAGIALAALMRFGLGVWPGVWLGSLAIALAVGTPLWLAALLAFGNTLGPLVGAWVLKRDGLHLEFDRRRDLWLFGSIGVGFSMAVTATNGTFWLAAGGLIPWGEAPKAWLYWWLGDAMGALVVGIPLLTLSRTALKQALGEWRWLPTGLLALGTLASAALTSLVAGGATAVQSPLFFLPHLLLCWLAARSGLFAASTTALLLIGGTVVATLNGIGPFHIPDNNQGVSLLVGYVCSLLAMPLLTTALTGEIAANERRWQLALDASQIGTGEWDLRTGRVEFSQRWLALLGHSSQAFGDSLHAFWALLHPDDVAAVQIAFEPLRAAGTINCRAECRMQCRDGTWRLFELHALVSERGPAGEPLRIVNTARDISDVQALRERQDLAESVFQHLHEGLLITDLQHRVLEANPTFTEITGYTREELIGTVPALLQARGSDTELALQLEAMRLGLASVGAWRGELSHHRRNGERCVLQATVTEVRNTNGSVRNHMLAIADVTHARAQFEQLQRQAHFDELTRLPNRVRLAQMLQAAIQASRRDGSLLTVCYLDLDHFKPVNDRFGHEAGDRLLVELAGRMRKSLRSWAGGDDVVARIGGDEFVLLLRTATLEESRHAVERVLNQVCQPYALGVGAGPVMVTASIGATVFPLDGADAETLLRHADHAMYGAKQAGRNGYLFFDAEHDRRAEARFVALGRVQEALDANEFRLYFQPKVDMRSAKVLGVEALLRWKHPEQGVISPAQFLPLIENTGLSISVGNWVLQHGIDQLARWLRLGLDITVSINISARHLQEPLFAQHLAGLLARHQTPVAHRLVIEVLETAALADVDYTCGLMEECRALGVRFALDDFGTGYSTFTYLKRLPIDMLKIDRSFVINMLGDRQDLAIVEGVIGLSQTFGCTVVAEGVETPAQAQRLIEIGCDIGQGNGIAAAMPADQVADWVRDYRGMPNPAQILAPV